MITLQTSGEFVDILSIENVTIMGVLLAVIFALVYYINRLEKRHEREKTYMREEIKKAQEKLDEEYKKSTGEISKMAENYHVFTTKVFERLNTLLRSG